MDATIPTSFLQLAIKLYLKMQFAKIQTLDLEHHKYMIAFFILCYMHISYIFCSCR